LIQGYANGALVITGFGALWALLPMMALPAQPQVAIVVVVVIVTALLASAAIWLLRAARQLSPDASPADHARGTRVSRWYALVFGSEMLAIALASILLGRTSHAELIPLVTGLIVGIHFLPLAALFHVPVYYLTGVVMIILASGALVALAFQVTLGGPYAWSVVIGLGNAVILWLTALYILVLGRQVRAR
jgi:hypothetical protein